MIAVDWNDPKEHQGEFPVDDVTIRRKLVALKAEHVDGEQDASERRQPRILSLGQSTLIHIGRSVWRTE